MREECFVAVITKYYCIGGLCNGNDINFDFVWKGVTFTGARQLHLLRVTQWCAWMHAGACWCTFARAARTPILSHIRIRLKWILMLGADSAWSAPGLKFYLINVQWPRLTVLANITNIANPARCMQSFRGTRKTGWPRELKSTPRVGARQFPSQRRLFTYFFFSDGRLSCSRRR